MSSRVLNESPWDKNEHREGDLDEEEDWWGVYRIRWHLLFSGAPVETQMPLLPLDLLCIHLKKLVFN